MNRRNVLIAAVALAVTMAVGDARADDGHGSVRLENLPECLARDVQPQSYWVRNNCDHTLRLEVDLETFIEKFDLYTTEERDYRIPDPLYASGFRVRSMKGLWGPADSGPGVPRKRHDGFKPFPGG